MNVAILLAGRMRGDSKMVSIHNENIGNYDTFISCLQKYESDWRASSWNIKDLFTTPEINFKETKWAEFRDDGAGESGFWQFWNLKNVINNVEEDYDWYIKSRSDLVFNSGAFTEDLFKSLKPNTFYCPAQRFDGLGWEYDWSLNDQLFIGDVNVMRVVSNFVTKYYNKHRHALNETNQYVGGNETSLRTYLQENGIQISIIHGVSYSKNHNGCTVPSGMSKIFQLETI